MYNVEYFMKEKDLFLFYFKNLNKLVKKSKIICYNIQNK